MYLGPYTYVKIAKLITPELLVHGQCCTNSNTKQLGYLYLIMQRFCLLYKKVITQKLNPSIYQTRSAPVSVRARISSKETARATLQ